jgi:hypothetical protein
MMRQWLCLWFVACWSSGAAAAPCEGGRCVLRLEPQEIVRGVVPARVELRQEIDEPTHYAMRFLGERAKSAGADDGQDEQPRLAITVVEPGTQRVTVGDEKLSRAVVTGHRVVATVGNRLYVGPVGGPLAPVAGQVEATTLDAVDDRDGTWVIFGDHGGTLRLGKIGADGKLGVPSVVARGGMAPRLARLPSGELAAAWVGVSRDQPSQLQLCWLDAKGKPRAAPRPVDSERTEPAYANIAMLAVEDGIDLAWAPPRVDDESAPRGRVGLEVRSFHVTPSAAPKPWPRVPVNAATWNVAGSAGGMLPIALQAVRVGRLSAFLWLEIVDNDHWRLHGMLAGGAAVDLGKVESAALFARNQGDLAWLYSVQGAGELHRARLSTQPAPAK